MKIPKSSYRATRLSPLVRDDDGERGVDFGEWTISLSHALSDMIRMNAESDHFGGEDNFFIEAHDHNVDFRRPLNDDEVELVQEAEPRYMQQYREREAKSEQERAERNQKVRPAG